MLDSNVFIWLLLYIVYYYIESHRKFYIVPELRLSMEFSIRYLKQPVALV